MAPVRFEIWTRPDTGTFTRKFPLIDVVDYTLKLGMFGSGTLVVPRDLARLDDILFVDPANHANDIGSLIRAYVGSSHLFDFYASRMAIEFGDLGKRTAKITGGALGSALERTRLRQFDWGAGKEDSIITPDWEYGIGANLLTNPGLEDGVPSFTFEEGIMYGFIDNRDAPGYVALVNGPETTEDEAESGTWSMTFDAPTTVHQAGVISAAISCVPGGNVTVTSKFLSNTSSKRFTAYITVEDGFTDNSTNSATRNGKVYVELDAAAQGAGQTDGTFQDFSLDVDMGTDQTSFRIGFDADDPGSAPVAFVDTVVFAGAGIGTDPWIAFSPSLGYTKFEVSTSNVRTGTFSLLWQGDDDTIDSNGPFQIISGLEVGAAYTAGFWVFHEAGANRTFRAVFKFPNAGWQVSRQVVVPTATYTFVSVHNTSVSAQTMWITLRKSDTTAGVDVHMDDASLTKGNEAANVGEILVAMLDDAATDHSGDNRTALAWLTVDFDGTNDSGTVAWDTDVSLRFKRGSTYRRIVEQFTTLGYEFDIRPDPADDTDLRIEAYNPDGLGTDQTTGDGGAILDGFIAAGPLIRREPAATYVMVEGESLQWADTRNTVLETPWGEIETYIGSKDQLVTGLATQAAAELAAIGQQELRFTVQNPTLTPGVDYRIGDIVRVTPGVIPTRKYRVMGITVKGDEPEPKYQISAEAQ